MALVTRPQVIQACLNLFEEPSYLEIGVWKGKTLFPARAASKVAVDPEFAFNVEEAKAAHKETTFHSETSDAYFGSLAPETRFDVIYLDGLHTSEQIIRDLINSLSFIHEGSIIVIDDVRPTSYHSSLANSKHVAAVKHALKSEDRNWMGDVYRVTFFVESFMQQFEYRTVSNNHGQLILWRKPRASVPERSLEWVSRAQFDMVFVEQASFNLMELDDIIAEIKASRAA